MENLIVEGAASALSQAFLPLLGGCGSFAEFEERALELSRRTTAEAMSRALESFDRGLASSRPSGSTVHSRRARTLATMTGDVRFARTVLIDAAGSTRYPLDEALGLPMGDRVSPSMRDFLVTCGADVPFGRTARLAAMGGGSRVSATTVMRSLRRCGEAIADSQREAARSLFVDGVAPEADAEAPHVLVEADGTYVTMRGGGPKAEVKAMVAYAGKRESEGGRVSRVDPVRLGCVGVAPNSPDPRVKDSIEGSVGMPAELIARVGKMFFAKYTGISDPDELKAYLQKIGLLYAFNVIFMIIAGGESGRAFASSLIENSLRKVVVPNAQTIKMLFQTM